ncbi:amino acid transporter [Allofrancisella guangzhouensis]|uniref:Amino acid transporter n=1 Tax=Allofrancisella guangzhouensis TaxID=594679 RepID=A0A0A8E2K9_9GAMM|nr:aromatic amino acid transport family protein [Allofrancisella guangzhouensis]AJC48440.1 amino acid transporter [Allofrancisella guangzhouensis]MBK2027659.1 amino acid transporter [Allofrancisella guangzhouensis]MBK2044688.1 amino acid transporter [Allofrancisella guangzhouensis]MBK2046476.1 amino acid transporter [Allofrancisella guangzhouensis]
MILSRKFGAAMIISGTCIGAGMLAIPTTVASCGFFIGSILIISIWALMTFTAIVLAEVNLKMEEGANFIEMTHQTLGPVGVCIVWVCYILLLYSLVAAYTVGGGLLITASLSSIGFILPVKITSIIFILVLGLFIYKSTRIVDHVNKIMLAGKLLAFFLLVIVLLPHVSADQLNYSIKNPNFIWACFPILLTSFGFHHIIPTLRTYVKSDKKSLRQAIMLGSTIPLIVYLLWIFATLGSIPVETADGILGKQSGEITSTIISHFSNHSGYISSISFLFGFFALATSFLGVALGLFDFSRSTYKLSANSHNHKILAFVITFLPAYVYAIAYPEGFKAALGYASVFVAILQVALPVAMLWVINYKKRKAIFYTSTITSIIVAIAVLIITLQALSSLDLLPALKTL